MRSIKGGQKELVEKLGRNDLCPCGSGRLFQEVLPEIRPLSMEAIEMSTGETNALTKAVASEERIAMN